jgi:tetratricopeptide (TPR) repeat protein
MEEGWKLLASRNPQQARQAVAVFQEGLDKIDPREPLFYNGLGRACLVAGQPRDAIAAWRKGLALTPAADPHSADMHSGIGWAYWHLQDPYHAKLAWEQALQINPKSPDAWTALAWIYLALGDKDRARDGFQILYETDHKNLAWINGVSMAKAGNSDPAQISLYFKLPPLDSFKTPPATDPAPQYPHP